MMSRRGGVTIIELLVTLISSSVILIGLCSIILQMANDQKHSLAARGQAFDRVRGLGEIAWTLKQAGRRGIRQNESGPSAVREVDDPNLTPPADGGLGVNITGMPPADYPQPIKRRGVITYVLDDFNQLENQPSGAAVPQLPERSRTGVIFQHESVIYKFEAPMTAAGTYGFPAFALAPPLEPWPMPAGRLPQPLSNRSVSGFNGMSSGQLEAFFNNAAFLKVAEVLCVGVDRLDVDYRRDADPDGPGPKQPPINPWAIRWEVVFFRSDNY